MVKYFIFGLRGGFKSMDAAGAVSTYQAMLADPTGMLFYSGVVLATTAVIVAGGVNKGIERVSSVLTPLRFAILICLLIYSICFADIGAAFRFLFTVDWTRLTPAVVVTAVGQAFFSLGIGVGVMLTMGAYMKPEYSIPRAVFTVAFAQGLVALIAGLSIFPLVFTYGLAPTQGPGLIFVTLPVAFGQMPYGQLFGTALFLTLSFAVITATTVILETVVSVLEEYTRRSRRLLAYASAAAIWLAGIVTVLSFNRWNALYPLRFIGIASSKTPFELLDYLTSNIMMPAGGLMVALIAGWALSRETTCRELGARERTRLRSLARGWCATSCRWPSSSSFYQSANDAASDSWFVAQKATKPPWHVIASVGLRLDYETCRLSRINRGMQCFRLARRRPPDPIDEDRECSAANRFHGRPPRSPWR